MTSINELEIEELDRELAQLTAELKVETKELKKNTDTLGIEFKKIDALRDSLEMLHMENEDLKQRLSITEAKHEQSVALFKDMIKKRDDSLKNLLQEVKDLNEKFNGLKVNLEVTNT